MKKARLISAVAAAAIAVSAFAAANVSAAETYNAYLGVQEPTNWSFRNAWNDENLGKGTEYFDQIYCNYPSDPTPKGGTFTDAVITGDGEYTVSLTGDFDFGDSEKFSLLYVSTDIPTDSGVTISNVKVKIDGSTKYTFDEAYLSPDSVDYLQPMAINQWNADLGGDEGLFGYAMPSDSVEITFTVSGMAAEAPAEEEAPATQEETPAPASDSSTTSTNTGNMPAAAIAAIAATAGAAVLVSRKRK